MESLCILMPIRLRAPDTLQALLPRLQRLGASLRASSPPRPPGPRLSLHVCV